MKKVLNGKSAQKSGFKSTQKSAQSTILLKKVKKLIFCKSKRIKVTNTQKSTQKRKSLKKVFLQKKARFCRKILFAA